jgi:hypothetical protein
MRAHKHVNYSRTASRFRLRRYLFAKGILPRPILEYLKNYYAILLANHRFQKDSQCPLSLALGGDAAFDAVLAWIEPEVARLVGFDLTPTYSYTRRYAKGEILKRHKDRTACEVSVTISITIPDGAGPSVIHLKAPDRRQDKVAMLEGDGCVYAGTEVEHWREPFTVDGYIQLFLHFIATKGANYPTHAFDGRPRLGARYR